MQGYLGIFRDIKTFICHTYRRATRERGEVSSAFFKNRKNRLDFWNKSPHSFHHWVKFSIENVIKSVGEKTPKFFREVFFSGVFDENFVKVLKFLKRPPILIWNIWQCSEYVCLDDCPVICKVTLCYLLHQAHSEFWHIQHFVFKVYPNIFKHTQRYWGILRHIEALRQIQAYSVILRNLYNPCIFTTLY